jgi:hypothetical protein
MSFVIPEFAWSEAKSKYPGPIPERRRYRPAMRNPTSAPAQQMRDGVCVVAQQKPFPRIDAVTAERVDLQHMP